VWLKEEDGVGGENFNQLLQDANSYFGLFSSISALWLVPLTES
jgi:hypothetical protein